MSRWTRGTWSNTGRVRSRNAIQRARRKGVSLSYWQRTPEKVYAGAHTALTEAAEVFTDDVYQAALDLQEWAQGEVARMMNIIINAADELYSDLERETPFDPNGPNDPPLHASESWRMKVESRNDKVSISISNPKDYIGFLEERGGRSDHPGSDDPGWISDAFNKFALNIQGNIDE